MESKTSELLDSLIKEIKHPEQFHLLTDQLFKRGTQALLEAEMELHLGTEKGEPSIDGNIRNGHSEKTLKTSQGKVLIKVPRDRKGCFEPVTIPKHKTMSSQLEDMIMLLYAKGMSTTDIVSFIEQTYGVAYSPTKVSHITNSLLENIKEWQSRPLESIYAVVWIDAIHYKIRQDGKVISKAAYVVLGVDLEGKQDILSIYILGSESASAWIGIFNDLKARGVEDILFLCSDNLTGIQAAVENTFSKSIHQICIVHQIRNSLKHVSYKDRKQVIQSLKSIYQADNIEQAKEAMKEFENKWKSKYAAAVQSWHKNWDALTVFLDFPQEIRKLIYTTNIIESFNAVLRKYTRNKKIFPSDDAALKSIYLAALQIKTKWDKTRFNWSTIHNQLYIYFNDRLK
jgi:putative transposase